MRPAWHDGTDSGTYLMFPNLDDRVCRDNPLCVILVWEID
jgi:hypothetical protein